MSDRALSSGISIPQWMRGKSVSGFDPSTLSPPLYDDDFFQFQFSKVKVADAGGPAGYRALGDVLAEQERRTPPRPRGVDDGFNGPKSACASSVVAVAKSMLGALPPAQRQRRNSKSLPASPHGSPETRRRHNLVNRFFVLEEPKDGVKEGGSTSSILEALNRETRVKSTAAPLAETFTPQPSELREMNFWSPTSM